MRYVIVGGGTAGVAAAQGLRALAPAASLVLVEAEAVPHYLRPGLIDVLAGRKGLSEITPYPKEWFEKRGIEYRLGEAVVALDLEHHELLLSSGKRIPFERLLLAAGAEPMRPEIPGVNLAGVFTLRTAADAERIRTWAEGKKRAVVLGGGWLGLEAGRALRDTLEEIVIVDREPWPLARQLDREAGQILAKLLQGMGLSVRGNAEATKIVGSGEVQGVQLSTGEDLPADLVLIAIGVRPRTALAQDAGLSVARGIVVNDFLETSFPGVYAAGDVAEWQGKVYGTVSAAREQALVAAQNMVEPGSTRYQGTAQAQRLKVAGIELLVLGESQPRGGPWLEERFFGDDRYVKLVLDEGRRLRGAIILEVPEVMGEVEQLFRERRAVPKTFLAPL